MIDTGHICCTNSIWRKIGFNFFEFVNSTPGPFGRSKSEKTEFSGGDMRKAIIQSGPKTSSGNLVSSYEETKTFVGTQVQIWSYYFDSVGVRFTKPDV
jgi:hypothetical protein